MQLTDKDVSAINDVISICKDAEQGFRGAADSVQSPSLKSLFNEYASQRATFARELESAMERTGAKTEHPSGTAGKLHSGWMHIKGALTGHSEHQILEETERGEDLSVKRYREALDKNLPEDLRSILKAQFGQVQDAHANIRRLRDQTAH